MGRGRISRASLQHTVAQLRSFLRFLASRALVAERLDAQIDTPRVYRGEILPRSLPWVVVRAFLATIDRSTAMGMRDYAMFLLVTTYGLRTCEVAGLCLDDVDWRADQLRVTSVSSRTLPGRRHQNPPGSPDCVAPAQSGSSSCPSRPRRQARSAL